MTDATDAVRTAAIPAGLSALAGLAGGPVIAATVGFVSGLPGWLIAATSLAAMIWLDPMTGIWLAITAAATIGGFILGTLRKPHPALYRMTSRDDGSHRIAYLENRLARASAREHALLTALTATGYPHPPATLPAPAIQSQVSR
jgi:hypothetical protein